MLFHFTPKALKSADVRLHPFLCARTHLEAGQQLDLVFKKHIQPTCEAILMRRFNTPGACNRSGAQSDDLENVWSMVMIKMSERLNAMSLEYQLTESLTMPIQDICGYTATTTLNAWKAHIRASKPEHTRMYRFVHSFLMNHKPEGNMPRMAAWEKAQGKSSKVWVGGLAVWQGREQLSVCSDRLERLLQNPKAMLDEAWECTSHGTNKQVCDWLSEEGFHVIFAWLKHPVKLNHLTQLLCAATGRVDIRMVSLEEIKDGLGRPDEEGVSALIQLIWECARTAMTPGECAVTLLGGSDHNGVSLIPHIFEAGLATHQEMANKMPISVDTLVAKWPHLPLNGKDIEKLLECNEQSVLDYRSNARKKLRKALADTLPD